MANTDPVTFRDAVGNVEVLDEIPLPDPQPCIEAAPLPLTYRVDFDTRFQDTGAFITGVAKYTEEAMRHAQLNEMLEEGIQHAVHLYTWRCCSRAIPMPKSNEQPNRVEIYRKVVEVMNPEVQKLVQFMYFTNRATARFCEEVKRLCHVETRKAFVSEAYLLTLGKFINMFAVLDELKNMKASIKNDYSTWRRAAQFLQVMSDSQALQESQTLSMFLATQNKIRDTIKSSLQKIEAYDDLLADVISICLSIYENQWYSTPAEKHMLIKILGFGVYLVDGENGVLTKLDQKKKLNIAKIDRVFKQMEVVPLFGDMSIQPFAFIRQSPHYDVTKWPNGSQEQTTCQVNIIGELKRIREEHTEYVTHLARIHNELAVYEKDGPRTDSENKELTTLALKGLQLLATWSAYVVEMFSWKLLHPTDPHQNNKCPTTAEEYERATRYNYSDDEKSALIEVIAMIKGLQMLLCKMEGEFNQAIRRHIYAELQDFVQITLREPLRKAQKNKKEYARSIIHSVREACADYIPGYEPADESLKGKKDHHDSAQDIRTPRRPVAPSSTQIYVIRTMLESLLCDRSAGKRTIRKELDGQHMMAIDAFLKNSYFWPTLLKFGEVLEEACDLSQLWYREFYLEMTMGQRIQFPIEMSMPWILTDHILTTRNPALMECILYQMDLYNDSAHFALTKFKKQFLYDEAEAEVNLCFDQFLFKLCEQIFGYYKKLAGCMLLDKRFKTELGPTHSASLDFPAYTRYETLMKQRHVQLLGRSIDLNRLITQRLNIAMGKSLDCAIGRFDASDITHIVELESAIELNKLCHKLMRKHLPGLTDFKDMLLEANHNVAAPYGRITLHLYWELFFDFLPHFSYNSSTNRFVRNRFVPQSEKVERNKEPQMPREYFWGSLHLNHMYSQIFAMYSGFVGVPHFRAIARLVGYEGIAVIFEELLTYCHSLLNGSILSYAKQLMKAMPKVCKLPRHDYGSEGMLEYYYAHLQDIITYSDLKVEVFQDFRCLGNTILFFLLLEQAMSLEEISDLLHAAPFQNVIPRPFCKEGEKPDAKIKRLEQKYSKLQVATVMERLGNAKQAAISREGDLLTKERLCCGLSLFEMVLQRLKGFLTDPVWSGPMPANGVMNIDECNEFHRLWSAIQFVYCMPVGEHQNYAEQLVGDGLHWAGCTLIVLLNQQRRFEALDFCYHVYRVQRVDGKDGDVKGIGKITHMVDRIRRFQVLNNQIFAVLNKHLRSGEAGEATGGPPVEHVRCFQPPIHKALAEAIHQSTL